jgi:chromate transporter
MVVNMADDRPAETRKPPPDTGNGMEVFLVFLKLGFTSFGGPIAHLGFFQREFVQRRAWIGDSAFGDLVAFCQFLPGPASSQVAISVGYMRAGIEGALAAWTGFTMPSAVLMIIAGYGFQAIRAESGFLHGLKIAAAAVVAQALWSMGRKFCPDLTRLALAAIAAGLLIGFPAGWLQIPVLAAGALSGRIFLRRDEEPLARSDSDGISTGTGIARVSLSLFFALLLVMPALSSFSRNHWIELADAFYRCGALVFGGGHVVLPLLESATVGKGWLTQNGFMAGYGAAQAVPGPLFSFAAYLGTVIGPTWVAGIWCLLWIYLPSVLLILGALPFWSLLRRNAEAQAALRGTNAVVVGILLAAFYNPVLSAAINSATAVIITFAAFALLQFWRWPPWLLVILCGLAGSVFLAPGR